MLQFIINLFKQMGTEPENTVEIDQADQADQAVNLDGLTDLLSSVYISYDDLDLISSVLKEVVYLYTQTGAGFSSELQERIRQAQKLLEH